MELQVEREQSSAELRSIYRDLALKIYLPAGLLALSQSAVIARGSPKAAPTVAAAAAPAEPADEAEAADALAACFSAQAAESAARRSTSRLIYS